MKTPEKQIQNLKQYQPIELTARVHTAEQLIYLFRGPVEWLQHVVRHFGNRSETAWAAVFGQQAVKTIYSLRDRIPGSSDAAKEAFIEKFLSACQEEEATAVSIYRQTVTAYEVVGPLISELLQQAISLPRYAYFERSNPLSPTEPGPVTYVILDPRPAVAIIRGADLRSCYFLSGIRGQPTDLLAVQSRIFWKCQVSRAQLGWADGQGLPAHPYTESTMGWRRLSRQGVAGRLHQFSAPRRGGER